MSFLLTKNPPIFQFDKMKKNNNKECSVDRHKNKKNPYDPPKKHRKYSKITVNF